MRYTQLPQRRVGFVVHDAAAVAASDNGVTDDNDD